MLFRSAVYVSVDFVIVTVWPIVGTKDLPAGLVVGVCGAVTLPRTPVPEPRPRNPAAACVHPSISVSVCSLSLSSLSVLLSPPPPVPRPIIKRVEELGLNVKAILLTHGHLDHVGAATAPAASTDLGPEPPGLSCGPGSLGTTLAPALGPPAGGGSE